MSNQGEHSKLLQPTTQWTCQADGLTTKNLCYAITCTVGNCRQQYIGTTHRSLRDRFREHLSYVDRNVEATGNHFNLPGHSKSDMKVTVLEKVHSRDIWMREEREHELIRKCNTFYKGINRQI